jgi:hypothetical protein
LPSLLISISNIRSRLPLAIQLTLAGHAPANGYLHFENIDVPIWPGETKAFKIDPRQVPVWEKLQREDHRPQPKKIQLKLEGLRFGDGTGYVGNEGIAIPRAKSAYFRMA